jgi:hypothetical protein
MNPAILAILPLKQTDGAIVTFGPGITLEHPSIQTNIESTPYFPKRGAYCSKLRMQLVPNNDPSATLDRTPHIKETQEGVAGRSANFSI